ncbi:hypothetical protein MKW92_025422, partial [Papaver armeniacum]
VDIVGVSCYSSKDLWTWKNEGIVLAGEETDPNHDLHILNVLERPKVIYNDYTRKYVMWMHVDDANYTKASTGIASSEDNNELHIGPLTDDYLDVTLVMRRILIGQHREAPALFKYQGTYYMITSGCTGWAPNEALAHAADSMMGPWETLSTYVVPLAGFPGSYLFMADRWNPANLSNSRYIWLPLIVGGAVDEPLEYNFGFPLWDRVSIYWLKRWRLPDRWSAVQ